MAAIGLKGGVEVVQAGFTGDLILAALAGLSLSFLLPVPAYLVLRRLGRLDAVNAAAVSAHYGRMLDILSNHQIYAYTVFPSSARQGHGGAWRDDQITRAQHKVLLLTVVDPSKADDLAPELEPLLDAYGMIFMLSAVKVLRDSKF